MSPHTEAHNLPARDLFFRVADRLQLESCLHLVAQDGKSVVLQSASTGLLEHYGQMLVQRLRQRLPETHTEIFFPTHTDALIARFNEVLEHLSVDAATQPAQALPPEKLWIVHDANALPEHELKLLLRLLQQFPGARISAVLMLSGWPAALRNVDPQGRRIARWDIEPPAQEQLEQFMAQAREQGREAAALELVSRVHVSAARGAPAAPTSAAAQAPSAAAARPQSAPPAASTPASPPSSGLMGRLGPGRALLASWGQKLPWQRLRQQWRWVLGGLALLAFSLAVALWLRPSAPRPAAPATPAAQTPAAAKAESSQAPTAKPALVETELPDIAQQGLAWLRVLGPGVFLVDHGLFGTAQEAQKKITNGRLYGARIVPAFSGKAETAEFMVITGPYPNEERARAFIQRVDPRAQARTSAAVLELGHAAGPSPQAR
jgi:hypothetical protein